MNLENLTQFDKRKFKRMLGLRIKETRESLGWTVVQMAEHLKLAASEVRQLEAGQKNLTQDSFDFLRHALNLNDQELLDITRITQAEMLMNVHREINEQYPK